MFFDGQFRSKRTINLGGRSAAHAPKDRAAILRQAHEERRLREENRRRIDGATKIQSVYRNHRLRTEWRARERAAWDHAWSLGNAAASSEQWVDLLRRLVFIFDVTCGDAIRLVAMVAPPLPPPDAVPALAQCPGVVSRFGRCALQSLPGLSDADRDSLMRFTLAVGEMAPRAVFGSESTHRLAAQFLATLDTDAGIEPLAQFVCSAAATDPSSAVVHLLSVPDLTSRFDAPAQTALKQQFPANIVHQLLGDPSSALWAQIADTSTASRIVCNLLDLSSALLAHGQIDFVRRYLQTIMATFMRFPDLERDTSLVHRLLDTQHVAQLFDAVSAVDLSLFCTVFAPLLPHLPLNRSPFMLLRRTGLVARLFTHVFPTTTSLPVPTGAVAAGSAPWAVTDLVTSQPALVNALTVLVDFLHRLYASCGDDEFYEFRWTARESLLHLAQFLKWLCFNAIHHSLTSVPARLLEGGVALLQHLFARDARRGYTPSRDFWWLAGLDTAAFIRQAVAEMPPDVMDIDDEDVDSDDEEGDGGAAARKEARIRANLSPRHRLLRDLPFLFPFEDRVRLFREYVARDRMAMGIAEGVYVPPEHRIVVRRDHVVEDGFAKIHPLGSRLKGRLAISFLSELGMEEAGIDGGGVFKEFFTMLANEAFDPKMGLFDRNPEQELYPSVHGRTQLPMYEFLGRVIGKVLYDGILVEATFAPFFINKWLGMRNFVDDMPSMDPELYKHLMFLKNYDGDVADLALDFTITYDGTRPRFSPICVRDNRIKYMYLVANYKLNVLIHRQTMAFMDGLKSLVQPEWLRMFSQAELTTLISGARADLDVADMRAHTQYTGGYADSHPVILDFWAVVEGMEPEDRRRLLRFITSCTRAPLLGFKELQPALCIRHAGDDQERLPTSSTWYVPIVFCPRPAEKRPFSKATRRSRPYRARNRKPTLSGSPTRARRARPDAVTALGPKLAKFNVTVEWGYDIHGVRGVKVAYTGPALPPVSVLQAAVPCLSYVEKDGTLAHAGVVPSGTSSATVAPPVSNDGSNSGMDGGSAAGDVPAATATGSGTAAANGKATGKSGAAPSATSAPISPVEPVSNATAVTAPAPPGQENACIKSEAMTVSQSLWGIDAMDGTLDGKYEYDLTGAKVHVYVLDSGVPVTAPAPPGQENACIKSEAMTVSQSLWGIDAMDGTLDGKYEYDLTGAKVHVYVLDSGVRFDHPEFSGSRADMPFTAKTLADDRQAAQLTDCTGHGTHVGAVIAGHTVGVAKQATVHALRIIGCDRTGSVSDAIEALNWVAANLQTPAVINLSLGSTDSLSGFTLPNAISALVNKGVHVVIAAGNSAVDACSSITPSTPSLLNIPNTYVVGALGHPAATDLAQGKYLPKIASFSNTGSCVKYWAPGVDIWSASNRSIAVDADVTAFESRQGTSQAAPMVAGAIALHLQATPTLTPADLTKSLSANGLALPWGGVHVLGPAPSSSSSKATATASALAFPLATCTTNNTGVAAALRQAFHSRRAPYYAIAAGTACTVIAVGGVAWWGFLEGIFMLRGYPRHAGEAG
ncbi:hypothetical protein AMAG_20330 [Allomyces macrogynus ATCC 38327]|uniref:HECT-type E3 ubiquitin transferase n=1 Tax=Allomyces macrogynus (strain ATCC 38327) TaxID=578462 RepID=A0A0L0T996_ALLM3|nr:hypothetical protein AMAG_20330 [Allomyces macrogynus ATCC 38327]|eukprot:KNE71291.1 hypothetical protein AMAG_20330 [Allomyces macrogynus ATCC 38327]